MHGYFRLKNETSVTRERFHESSFVTQGDLILFLRKLMYSCQFFQLFYLN